MKTQLPPKAIVTEEGITLPRRVRQALDLNPGDIIEFAVEDGRFVGRKLDSGNRIADIAGIIDDPRTTDEIMRELRGETWGVEDGGR